MLLILLLTGVPPLAVAALMALYWLAVASWLRAQGARVLRAVGARGGLPEELARIENLVQGLADDLGIAAPEPARD